MSKDSDQESCKFYTIFCSVNLTFDLSVSGCNCDPDTKVVQLELVQLELVQLVFFRQNITRTFMYGEFCSATHDRTRTHSLCIAHGQHVYIMYSLIASDLVH